LLHDVSSGDEFYDGLAVALNVNILDNDLPGVEIYPTQVLTTNESGVTVTYTLQLASQPTNTVSLVLESQDPGEGQVLDPYGWVLTFYPDTWNTPQTLTIIGVDDGLDDDAIPYTITVQSASPDPRYDDLTATLSLLNQDNDGPQISIADISVIEADVESVDAIFTIQLNQATAQDISVQYRTINGSAIRGALHTHIRYINHPGRSNQCPGGGRGSGRYVGRVSRNLLSATATHQRCRAGG
jgi:hypothetical protein